MRIRAHVDRDPSGQPVVLCCGSVFQYVIVLSHTNTPLDNPLQCVAVCYSLITYNSHSCLPPRNSRPNKPKYVHTHTHMHTYAHTQTHNSACTHTHTHTHEHTHTHTRLCTLTRTYIYIHTHTPTCTNTPLHTHTCIQPHIQPHLHTRTTLTHTHKIKRHNITRVIS